MCLVVSDGIFVITVQVPVILSVLSNSYDEERAYNKTWLQNDSAKFPRCVPNTGTCPGRCWLPSFSTDLRGGVQHLSVKASSICCYELPPASVHA